MDESSVNPRKVWNQRFSHLAPVGRPPRGGQSHAAVDDAAVDDAYEPWLERWMPLLETTGDRPILDLGCGSGRDACYLTSYGLPVFVADFARQALNLTAQTTRGACAHAVELDLREGLPFRYGAFRVVIANLSLHYHRWHRTQLIIDSVRRRLTSGGYLLARFNSTNDVNYGAQGHRQVEPRCYVVSGVLKRFFNEDDLQTLFSRGWRVHSLEEQVVHCYRKPKTVWEIVAKRAVTGPSSNREYNAAFEGSTYDT